MTRSPRPSGPRNRIGALVAGAAAIALLTGCAGQSDAGGEEGGDVTLNFAWWGDASRAERYEAAIAEYEQRNPNVTIRTGYAGFGDYWTARNTEAASRSLPDVFQMDLAYLAEYGSFGHVAELDDYLGEEITVDTIDPTLLEAGVIDGSTYGVASSSSAQSLIVNEPLLAELGVALPEAPYDWDEFDAFLAEIGEAGAGRSPVVAGAIDYTQSFWTFQVWLNQQGLSFIEDGELGFDEDDLAEWWGRSANLHESGAAMAPDRLAQLEGVDPLGAGETVVDTNWDNFLPRFSEGPAAPELTLLDLPVGDSGDTGLFLKPGLQLSIGANSEHPEEAARFIDFLINDPDVGGIFGMSRGVPTSSEAITGIEATPLDERILAYEDSIAEKLDGTVPESVRGFGTLEQTFVAIAGDVGFGVATVDEAVERWFGEAQNALGS